MKYTPENVGRLQKNQVFVYGSNQYAQHGAGSAKVALKFGAVYGAAPTGLLGQSYGIITTSFNSEAITPEFLITQICTLYGFARVRPDLEFLVTKVGTGLAGFTIDDMAAYFRLFKADKPDNIILPIEFS